MPGPYTPNPTDDTKPLDSDPVGVGAAEFRTLKGYIQQFLTGITVAFTGATTLTNGQLGSNVAMGGAGVAYTVGLPVANTCQKGLGFCLENQSTTPTAITIACGASDHLVLAGNQTTTLILNQGDFIVIAGDSTNLWYVGANSLTLPVQLQLPVGSVHLSTTNTNPGLARSAGGLGYGTWTQIAEGRVLVGVGTGTDINAVTQTFAEGNDTVGEYVHTQTVSEMPGHHHQAESRSGGGITASFATSDGGVSTPLQTDDTGGGAAMNNTQPSFGVYIWNRTA